MKKGIILIISTCITLTISLSTISFAEASPRTEPSPHTTTPVISTLE